MKILAIERGVPSTTAEHFKPHLRTEAIKVWELYQAGEIRELYFDRDKHSAVLILECSETEEARQMLDTLPLVKAGLITFEVIALTPYPGFSRLFVERP
jgi:hypothetical protein